MLSFGGLRCWVTLSRRRRLEALQPKEHQRRQHLMQMAAVVGERMGVVVVIEVVVEAAAAGAGAALVGLTVAFIMETERSRRPNQQRQLPQL